MTETAATPQSVPVITADPFSPKKLMQPHALHEQLREAGPVVYFERYQIWAMARYEQVNAALKNWETYSSAAGAGLSKFRKEKPWRTPSLLLEADPPYHTRARLEGEIMLTALANRVERIEFTGQPQRKPNNTLLAWSNLPNSHSLRFCLSPIDHHLVALQACRGMATRLAEKNVVQGDL